MKFYNKIAAVSEAAALSGCSGLSLQAWGVPEEESKKHLGPSASLGRGLYILRSLHKWSLSRGEAGDPAVRLGSTHASYGNLDELLIF